MKLWSQTKDWLWFLRTLWPWVAQITSESLRFLVGENRNIVSYSDSYTVYAGTIFDSEVQS